MRPIQLEGTKIATTAELRQLAELAEQEEHEHRFDARTLERLDPNGTHVVNLMTHLMPGGGAGVMDLTFKTPLPCEVFIKPVGTMTMLRRVLDISVYAYKELTDVPPEYRNILAFDGQRRLRWN